MSENSMKKNRKYIIALVALLIIIAIIITLIVFNNIRFNRDKEIILKEISQNIDNNILEVCKRGHLPKTT